MKVTESNILELWEWQNFCNALLYSNSLFGWSMKLAEITPDPSTSRNQSPLLSSSIMSEKVQDWSLRGHSKGVLVVTTSSLALDTTDTAVLSTFLETTLKNTECNQTRRRERDLFMNIFWKCSLWCGPDGLECLEKLVQVLRALLNSLESDLQPSSFLETVVEDWAWNVGRVMIRVPESKYTRLVKHYLVESSCFIPLAYLLWVPLETLNRRVMKETICHTRCCSFIG